MSLWSDLRDAIRQAILLQERVERLMVDVTKTEERVSDYERRLTRVETIIGLASAGRLPPPN